MRRAGSGPRPTANVEVGVQIEVVVEIRARWRAQPVVGLLDSDRDPE
jgi:hypothetical protein